MEEGNALPRLEARVRLYHDEKGETQLLGFADLAIAGAFVIKGIRIMMARPKEDRPGGPFISFPAKKGSGAASDKYFEIAHPITSEARAAVRDLVLKAYEEEVLKLAATAAG